MGALVAAAGGMLAAPAAVIEEAGSGAAILLPFVAAPVIEEILKPSGVYLLLWRWPHVMPGRMHGALLAAVGGLAFGLVESAAFVTVAVDEPSRAFVIYRFSGPVAMHVAASFVAGLGIGPSLAGWVRHGTPLPKRTVVCYGVAVAAHALYNLAVISLGLSGVLDPG
jgi:RsiW-degrading membrane proteinase PrsW (M82 family)